MPEPRIVEPFSDSDIIMVPVKDESEDTQTENDYMQWLSDEILFSSATWSGIYSGMYSVKKTGMVPKPTEECLGAWIAKDIIELREFRNIMLTDYWNVAITGYENAWQAAGDLMFKNFDQCHFKAVLQDVSTYCSATEVKKSANKTRSHYDDHESDSDSEDDDHKQKSNCSIGKVTGNIQQNVFALITQTSGLAA